MKNKDKIYHFIAGLISVTVKKKLKDNK